MPAELVKKIMAQGGGDYTDLGTAISAESTGSNRDLVASSIGPAVDLVFELYANGTAGIPFSTNFPSIDYSATGASGAFRTDATHRVVIRGAATDRAAGPFDASKAKLKKSSTTAWPQNYVLTGTADFVAYGFQIEWAHGPSTDNVTFFYPGGGGAKYLRYYELDSVHIRTTGTYTAGATLTFVEDGYSDFERFIFRNCTGDGITVGYYLSEQQQPQVGERLIANNTMDLNGDSTLGAFGLGATAFQSKGAIVNNIATSKTARTNVLFANWLPAPAGWLVAGNVSSQAEGYGAPGAVIESATVTYTDRANGDFSLAASDTSGAKSCGIATHEWQNITTPFRHDATSLTMRRPVPWSAGAIQYGGEGTGVQVSAVGALGTTLTGDIAVPYPAFLPADAALASGDLGLVLELVAEDTVTSDLAALGWTASPANNTNTNSTPNLRTEVWAKAVTGSETGSLTVPRTGGGVCAARMYSVRGVTPGAFDAAVASAGTSTTGVAFGTLTTAATNARVQAFIGVASQTPTIDAAPTGGAQSWARHVPYAAHDPRAQRVYAFGSNNNANPNSPNFMNGVGSASQPIQIPVPAYAKPGDTLACIITIRSTTLTPVLGATGLTQRGAAQTDGNTTATTTARFYDKVLTASDPFGGYLVGGTGATAVAGSGTVKGVVNGNNNTTLTFSTTQAGLLAAGSQLTIGGVTYVLLTFNGSTSATIAPPVTIAAGTAFTYVPAVQWTAQTFIMRNVGAQTTMAQSGNGPAGATAGTAKTFPSVTWTLAGSILALFAGADVRVARQSAKTSGQTTGGTWTMGTVDYQTAGDGAYVGTMVGGTAVSTASQLSSSSLSYNLYPTPATLGPTITMSASNHAALFSTVYPPAAVVGTTPVTLGVGMLSATGGTKAAAGTVSGVTATLSAAAVKTGILYSLAPYAAPVSNTGSRVFGYMVM